MKKHDILLTAYRYYIKTDCVSVCWYVFFFCKSYSTCVCIKSDDINENKDYPLEDTHQVII